MSRKPSLQPIANVPDPPGVDDKNLSAYLKSMSSALRDLQRCFSRYTQADMREQPEGQQTAKNPAGMPTASSMYFNVVFQSDGLPHKVDGTAASWALQFSDSPARMSVLHCAAGVDPIVWSVFLTEDGSGIPVNLTDIVTLEELYLASCAGPYENRDALPIKAGQAVTRHVSGIGFVRADATYLPTCSFGLAVADVASGFSERVQLFGVKTMADWTSVVGSAYLTARATYYLDPAAPGHLTEICPVTPGIGLCAQKIGVALNLTDLDVQIRGPYQL